MPVVKDLTGMKFGLLTVMGQTEKRENGYLVWRCKCQCGNEAFVNTKRLLRGTVTNCGCIPKLSSNRGSVAEDLSGRRFGEWEVLKRADNKNGRVMWLCRCSCGTKKSISAHDLKAGKTRSCRSPIHFHLYNRRDLTGKTFGSMEVLHYTERRDYKGSVLWHCRCRKCGKEKDMSEDNLVNGHYKSCGCEQYVNGEKLTEYRHFYKGTCVEALRRKMRNDNKTGVTGVYKNKNGTYRCSIRFQGRVYYLGTYSSFGEASFVRRNAENQLHGRFIEAYTAWMQEKKETGREKELIFQVDFINREFLIQSNYLPGNNCREKGSKEN